MRTGSKIKINLILIRHGKTASNESGKYIGRTEESLSEAGIRELKEQTVRMVQESGRQPDYLFTSPMVRCVETAAILFPHRNPVMIERWKEIDFGSFEGKTYLELSDDPDYQAWIDSNGELAFPEGESRAAFISRTIEGFMEYVEYLKKEFTVPEYDEIQTAAVVHGGTIMAICSYLTGGGYFDYQVKNGNGYRLELHCESDGIHLQKLEELS